jgi:hypothetical protein
MNDLERLEAAAAELINTFEIHAPPVPVETMLAQPRETMWEKVDITQLSGVSLSVNDRYGPRMSFTRLLVRHVAGSEWGRARQLPTILQRDAELVQPFARMIIMPAEMVLGLSAGARNPTTMSIQFEVPESDARLRLQELAGRM